MVLTQDQSKEIERIESVVVHLPRETIEYQLVEQIRFNYELLNSLQESMSQAAEFRDVAVKAIAKLQLYGVE